MIKIICTIILVLNLLMCYINVFKKKEKPRNNVHFYVARNKNGDLYLYFGKPRRYAVSFISWVRPICHSDRFDSFGLKEKDYANLKWEDDPVEVFINMDD